MSNTDRIFFTSDAHFDHKNIVKYTGRPWDQEQNNEQLIERWNSRVSPGDTVYHLGDFSFLNDKRVDDVIRTIQELNGDIHFILGNHCSSKMWNKIRSLADQGDPRLSAVQEVVSYKRIRVGHQGIILFHYPITVWDGMHHGAWHLHGHCHGSFQGEGKILDVGIDNHPDFQVYSFAEVEAHMAKQSIAVHDHHKGEA